MTNKYILFIAFLVALTSVQAQKREAGLNPAYLKTVAEEIGIQLRRYDLAQFLCQAQQWFVVDDVDLGMENFRGLLLNSLHDLWMCMAGVGDANAAREIKITIPLAIVEIDAFAMVGNNV